LKAKAEWQLTPHAPDLCYQKLLAKITNETLGTPIPSLAPVTESEIASYRDSHPTAKSRRTAARRHE